MQRSPRRSHTSRRAGARRGWRGLSARARPPDLGQHLARRGFALQQRIPGMAVDLGALPEAVAVPPGLTIEEAADAGALGEWAGVIVVNSGRPASFGHLLLAAHATLADVPGRPIRHFLARLGGRPVGTALGFVAVGVAGLYWVATLPEFRGRGVGAAVSLAPLRAAREEGYRVGILHASPLGLPIYRRLGFEERCTFDFWTRHG
jgi:GNAT superfamily N-acetyltransferase